MAKRRKKRKVSKAAARKWRAPVVLSGTQLGYYRFLMLYTRKVASVFESTVMKALDGIPVGDAVLDSETDDAMVKAFETFLRRVDLISPKQVEAGVKQMVDGVVKFERKVFVDNCKNAIGVDIRKIVNDTPVGKEMKAAVQENIKLIKSIGKSYEQRASKIISQGLTSGKDGVSIKQELYDLGGFKGKYKGTEQRRAKLIARDQTQKLANTIDRVRQKHYGVKHYIWSTAKDSRVRSEHKKYDGKRYSWDDPPPDGHPGEAVQCRCTARPDLDELLDGLDEAEE
jgi:SPP1 gp7 family putative phage head morphogenesis protein